MRRRGLTLLEIVVATIILALVIVSLANVFVLGKRYVLHSRARMAGGELGRFFLDPLQMDVDQGSWGNNCLSTEAGCPGAENADGRLYTPTYDITNNSPVTNLNKVKVTIHWDEIPL